MSAHQSVLFFDGICGLCNGFVDFVIANEKRKEIQFSPLQSEFAKRHLPKELTEDLSTLVFLKNGKILTKSDAVLAVCAMLGVPWKFVIWLQVFPKPFRDLCYDFIAQTRYQIFGKRETCRLPTAEEKSRFLL
ncbi:MAG: thiol-disulfide oxidoreductase DCC family protein [Pseudobdellovibrionaceae bacterium]